MASKVYCAAIKICKKLGYDIDRRLENDTTYLHKAVLSNKKKLILELIRNKAEIEIQDINGETPLHYAAKHYNKDIVKILIDNGADINARNNDNNTPFHLASGMSKVNKGIIELFLQHDANVNVKGNKGFTPLHFAAKSNQIWLAKQNTLTLIKHGANVNAQSDEDGTPLHLAVEKKNAEIVKILVENGADVGARDNLDQTPLHLALSSLSSNDQNVPPSLVSNVESRNIIQILINNNANVNDLAKEEGYSPLHEAIIIGDENMVRYLIKIGADVNLKSQKNAETPLHLATSYSSRLLLARLKAHDSKRPLIYEETLKSRGNVIKMLIQNGANIETLDGDGYTPLYKSSWADDNCYAFKILVQNGAQVNSLMKNGTPLMYRLLDRKKFDFAKILLNHGGDIEAIFEVSGNTILMNAVKHHRYHKCWEVIKWLLENGANWNTRHINEGYTAMDLAIRLNLDDIVFLMICYGVSLKIPNSAGCNFIECALDLKKTKAFKAILVTQQMF